MMSKLEYYYLSILLLYLYQQVSLADVKWGYCCTSSTLLYFISLSSLLWFSCGNKKQDSRGARVKSTWFLDLKMLLLLFLLAVENDDDAPGADMIDCVDEHTLQRGNNIVYNTNPLEGRVPFDFITIGECNRQIYCHARHCFFEASLPEIVR